MIRCHFLIMGAKGTFVVLNRLYSVKKPPSHLSQSSGVCRETLGTKLANKLANSDWMARVQPMGSSSSHLSRGCLGPAVCGHRHHPPACREASLSLWVSFLPTSCPHCSCAPGVCRTTLSPSYQESSNWLCFPKSGQTRSQAGHVSSFDDDCFSSPMSSPIRMRRQH